MSLNSLQKKNDFIDYKRCKLPKNEIYIYYEDIFKTIVSKFDDIDSFDIETNNENIKYLISKEQNEKFLNIYCCSPNESFKNLSNEIWLNDFNIEDVGINEYKLLKFCTNNNGKTIENNLHYLSADCGRGKSSLLTYTLIYLRTKSPILQSSFIPIIFNLHTFKVELDFVPLNELEAHIKKSLIEPQICNLFGQLFLVSNDSFWNWYEKQKLKTKYSIDINNARVRFSKNKLKDFIYELREKELKTIDFFIYCIKYIKTQLNTNLVIVFDNLDPFNIDFIERIFWISKNIINLSGNNVKFILTLRNVTLNKLYRNTKGILRIENGFIEVPTINIINKRCQAIENSIQIAEGKNPLQFENVRIILTQSPVSVFRSFLNIIKSQKGVDLIKLFSNNNIRYQLDILDALFSSYLIPIQLFKILLVSQSENCIEIPEGQIIKAIVTNGYTTFFSFLSKQQSENIPGVVNILSSANNYDEFTIFSKLMLLTYLEKKKAEINISIENIFNDLNNILAVYNNELKIIYQTAFYHALTRFLNQGLIISPDTEHVSNIDEFKKCVNEISLTSLGKYYINVLLSEPEYIIYIKDDTYVSDISLFKDCNTILNTVKPEKLYYSNVYETIKFINIYFEMELSLYNRLIQNRTWFTFKDFYSSKNNNFYTFEILNGIEKTFKTNAKMATNRNYFIDSQEFLSEIPSALNELKDKIIKNSKKIF